MSATEISEDPSAAMSFLSDLSEDGVSAAVVAPPAVVEGKVNGCQKEKRHSSARKSVRYDDSLVTVLEYSLDDDIPFPSRPKTPPPRPPTPPPFLGENGEEDEEEGEGEEGVERGEGEGGEGGSSPETTGRTTTSIITSSVLGEGDDDDLFDLPPLPQIPPSPPLESRDNPFLPGGELEKEADDLLKHAVIIRDKIYLDADGNRLPCSPTAAQPGGQQAGPGPGVGPEHPGDHQGPGEVEETMTAAPCTNSQVSAEPKRRENGKVSEASPDNVKVDLVGKDGQGGGGAPEEEAADAKDKKKRNKCCSVM